MSTIWTNDSKLIGQSNILYDDATITYDQVSENYIGQNTTIWTNDSKN